MIFYFSGTGNSLAIAKHIGDELDDKIITMHGTTDKDSKLEYRLHENETLGFIFPIYAWGVPKIVVEYINNVTIHQSANNYIYSIITCGDTIGNGMKQMEELLKTKGLQLHSGFSIIMPNNYIIMGSVDPSEVAAKKIEDAAVELKQIIQKIKIREQNYFNLKKGSNPWLLTKVINPLFNKFATDASKFYAEDSCINCGICEKICKYNNIRMNEKPVWGDRCTQCLSCMHYCPKMAVQYGKGTKGKERYYYPGINLVEMIEVNK